MYEVDAGGGDVERGEKDMSGDDAVHDVCKQYTLWETASEVSKGKGRSTTRCQLRDA